MTPHDPRTLRGTTGQFATGVTIVICQDGHGVPHAAAASSFVAVSTTPPLIALFFHAESRMASILTSDVSFSVNMLGVDDAPLARRLGRPGRPSGWEGLSGVALSRRDPQPPVLERAIAWLECVVERSIPTGDHRGVIARVVDHDRRVAADPLLYYRGRFHPLGDELGRAPWAVMQREELLATL